MTGNVDLRRRAIGRNKRRRNLSLLDAIVFAVEVDLTIRTPESIADSEKLFGARVTLVVREVVAVTALLFT